MDKCNPLDTLQAGLVELLTAKHAKDTKRLIKMAFALIAFFALEMFL
jgi:hypothetical protein